MFNRLLAVSICVCLLTCCAAVAEDAKAPALKSSPSARPALAAEPADVEALINSALAAYKAGKTDQAVTELQKAINTIQRSRQKGLAALFPNPPAGWEAGEIESQSGSFSSGKEASSYIHLSRTYTRKQDDMKVEITVLNIPQLMEAQRHAAEAYKNPEFLKMANQQGNKVEAFEQDGWSILSIIEKGDAANLTATGKAAVLTIHVNKDDEGVLKTFLKAVDFKAAGEAGGAKSDQPAGAKPAGKSP